MSWSIVRPSRRRHPFGAPGAGIRASSGARAKKSGENAKKSSFRVFFQSEAAKICSLSGRCKCLNSRKASSGAWRDAKRANQEDAKDPKRRFSGIFLRFRCMACANGVKLLASAVLHGWRGAPKARQRVPGCHAGRACARRWGPGDAFVGFFSPSVKPSPWGAQCDTLYP